MIYHYFNTTVDNIEKLLNEKAKDGYHFEQMEITGSLVHVIVSKDITESETVQPKRVYKVKNGNV